MCRTNDDGTPDRAKRKPGDEALAQARPKLQDERHEDDRPDRAGDPLGTLLGGCEQEHAECEHSGQHPDSDEPRHLALLDEGVLFVTHTGHYRISATRYTDGMMNVTWFRGDLPDTAITELIERAEEHDGYKAVSDQAMLEARGGERDALLAFDGNNVVALGIVGNGEVDLLVSPHARGRGIGRRLFDQLVERAGRGVLKAWVHGDERSGREAAEHLLTGHGFSPIRTLLRLHLDGAALAGRPLHRHGLALGRYTPQDAAEIVRVNAAAFHDHPEQGRLTLEGFLALTREPWFDPQDLRLLWEGEGDARRLIAFTWVKTLRGSGAAGTETELYVIGVHPDAAGRGLGTRLLEATLDRMAEHRPARVTLYVEGDNTPALRLYKRAGFTELQRSNQWARTVDR